jgi:hypothetical protein
MPFISHVDAGFRNIKMLIRRLNANRQTDRRSLISIDPFDMPPWQRQIVWTPEEMGLLAYSIIQNYPIGLMVLWKKEDGIRVPIDGRQRLTAIREFFEGRVAIPDLPIIPDEFKNKKYKLHEGDEENGFSSLDIEYIDAFEDYTPFIVQYEDIEEKIARDIFVRLQGGKSLTKTEIRAALGGKICDFVTELTSPATIQDESDDEELPSQHPFFQKINIRNIRKQHRNLCDVLLHEYLYPGQDKHWTSLEQMYLEKAATLSENEKTEFKSLLGKFQKAVEFEEDGERIILPQLKSVYLVLTYYKAWIELNEKYILPRSFNYAEIVRGYESERVRNPDVNSNLKFKEALSNAGYSQGRIEIRHSVLMEYIMRTHQTLPLKNRDQRAFSQEQKIEIWERAQHQCEWIDENENRCQERFANFRQADADHIVKWNENGPTTIANGRLLCQTHNRGRRE